MSVKVHVCTYCFAGMLEEQEQDIFQCNKCKRKFKKQDLGKLSLTQSQTIDRNIAKEI